MNIKHATIKDIPAIMSVIKDAQNYLAGLGIDQWQDGYPTVQQIELDIKNGDSYLIYDDDNNVMGTTVFTTKKEPTYQAIEGEWLTGKEAAYGVIHRLAVADRFRKSGLAKFVFNYCHDALKKQGIKSLRIDTHRDNKGMQNLIQKMGYSYCGVIIIESGAERLAYEKMMD